MSETRELEKLFSAPPGEFGTHLMLCGLSADVETLERLMGAFTGEAKLQRAAAGLLRGILLLDASASVMSAMAVPGLLQLAPCEVEEWSAMTSLMHAKVALMGFAPDRYAAPTRFRLIISTGNWTRESWGSQSQIDFFWSTDWIVNATDTVSNTDLDKLDVAGCLSFFSRMLTSLYRSSFAGLRQERLAMGWFDMWAAIIGPPKRSKKGRFIHSLDTALFGQIKSQFPEQGVSTLLAGSGFFEQGKPGSSDKPEVLEKLEELASPGTRYLVFNPNHAGALSGWMKANRKKIKSAKLEGWEFCMPRDPLQANSALGRTRLHAKYIAGLKRIGRDKRSIGKLAAIYIGSGNLSRLGLLSHARINEKGKKGKAGNVEAGIVINEEEIIPQVWQKLACGNLYSEEQIDESKEEGVEPIFQPKNPPPVLFARAQNRLLELVRSSDTPLRLQIKTHSLGNWIDIEAGQHSMECPEPISPIIWVRLYDDQGQLASIGYEVPVFTADGLLCRQTIPQAPVEDILEALRLFPSIPPHLPEPGGVGTGTAPSYSPATGTIYPLKVLSSLIEAIAQRNTALTEHQFPVWLSQLRVYLLEQTAEIDRKAIQSLGIDLFPALFEPGFIPDWLHDVPHMREAYENVIADIRAAWSSPQALSLTAPTLQKE